MRVEILSPYPQPISDIVGATDEIVSTSPDMRVSYGHPRILGGADLDIPTVNLHIAYLPWNRGADPNFWSWRDGTPKGVTVHWIDAGVDTGDIIAQREVAFSEGHTLATSYCLLRREMEALFSDVWPMIRNGTAPRTPQNGGGSHHYAREFAAIRPTLPLGWQTPVTDIA